MARTWKPEDVLDMAWAYQPMCVLAAGVELDVFTVLDGEPMSADELAGKIGADRRGVAAMADALTAQDILTKDGTIYSVPPGVAKLLSEKVPGNVLPMVRHQANCLRRWAQLSRVIISGEPAERIPSVRGAEADQAAFIGAMNNFSAPVADQVVDKLQPLRFRHLLDVGGASGTWTLAFLRALPTARATIFDLPEVIPLAQERISKTDLAAKISFAGGDFYVDDLPGPVDLAWLGAIAHQNSRHQNCDLFAKVHAALEPGGSIVIRDVVMDDTHTKPIKGALFAINMLVATEGGGTYSLAEYKDDLEQSGFTDVTLICQDEFMNSLIRAVKP